MHIKPKNEFALEESLDLRKLQTTGSILHINEHLDETDYSAELSSYSDRQCVDFIGQKVGTFSTLAESMTDIHPQQLVKKKIIEEGGGLPLKDPCSVFIAFSGYLDNADEPFDIRSLRKPLEVNLTMTDNEEHGLIPGLDVAIKSMLVGELSLFLISHQLAYQELGIPPRIPPKAQCAFYVKLVKCTLNSEKKKINFREANMFGRVDKEVRSLYGAGTLLFKSNNFTQAAKVFNKAIWMLHKCRLADEEEEKNQEKWLKKLYFNSAVCYNRANLPLKACISCNELNRLQNLWNNSKALFQNAKALRMIGQYDAAEKRLLRAKKLCSDSHYDEIVAEIDTLKQTKESCNQQKLFSSKIVDKHEISEDFKQEVISLLKNFKENPNLCQLVLPAGMSSSELKYLREICVKENLFMRSVDVPIDSKVEADQTNKYNLESTLAIDKEDYQSSGDDHSEISPSTCEGKEKHENLMKET